MRSTLFRVTDFHTWPHKLQSCKLLAKHYFSPVLVLGRAAGRPAEDFWFRCASVASACGWDLLEKFNPFDGR